MEKIVGQNSAAHYHYFIKETVECGVVLYGSEVKSLRVNRASLADAHADFMGNEAYIYKMHIPEYECAKLFKHESKRPKKLLLHRRQIKNLIGLTSKKGMTLVPLKVYFNSRNKIKILLGISQGKKKSDKRQVIKEREWQRVQRRAYLNQSE